ncbi:uncharacterized protein LOC123515007 isoform X8 [Portunus trituberculatus]|uniref:uncharacterized protein LOC123515007 isoform X8 n=1 Tax=Portunus trituberculatus TaxID=210409 RepID=UPI001E1CF8FB|nr:uncharacterized protein LOC123515007 isoform X8 [Portunus trituberculatus]
MDAELGKDLPQPWSYAVTQDGRIFFINEEARLTTWLHPLTCQPALTGHRSLPDLPKGWERGVTPEGIPYYINHNRQETTLVHPVTHKTALQAEAIPPPPPAATQRCEASSAAPVPSGLNNHESRKGAGRRRGGSWVKTPGARRPEVAPVTLQGWLYKQGADGLHLWKKRWFVLSEYCLYYYKGPDEDKVLGSLPLPSFKISPVDSEDRVYRRHAFKAEHQNTRTYYFAAETKEQMTHWMNALSLASILQKDTSIEEKLSSGSSARRSERPSVSSLASTASPSADESDSGFHGYRSRRYRSPDGRSLDEASESSRLQGDRLNTSCDSSVILRPGDRQPLYANAPPKPKRLNSSRDYSTSPERSPERDERDPRTYTDHGGGGSSGGCSSGLETRGVHYHPPSAERRTPDAYGVTAGGGRGDYEDVYGDSNGSNSTPHSPIRRGDQRDSYASSRSGGTRLSEELQLSEPLRSKFCRQEDTLPRDSHHRHCPTGPPRPHSADFLEYDRRHGKSEMWSYRRGSGGDLIGPNDTRPKSSVGQNESDHWSEENYAQKMRQSSLYHSHMHSRSALRYSPAGPPDNPIIDHHHLHSNHSSGSQRVPPAGAATPDLYTPHKQTPVPTTMNATNSLRRGIGQETPEMPKPDIGMDPRSDMKPYPRHAPRHTPPQQDLKPELRHNHRPDPSLDLRRTYNYEDAAQKHDVSPNTTLNSVPTPPGSYPSSASPNGSVNNNFMRSASARLPRQRLQDDVINTSLPDDTSDGDTRKMQQREESMKRLLEWKQRMLQSPLTRKPNARPDGTTTPQPRTNHEAYRQQVLSELANQEARTKVLQSHSHTQSYATSQETHPVAHTGPVAGQSFEYTGNLGTSQGQAPCQNNWTPGIQNANTGHMQHGDSNLGGMYFPPGMPSERPAPQGGSSQTGSDSGSSKKREGRREASRTRHVSGDARRSTSASRYNSYSSDEDDLLEERETRKRTRRNSRRSSADLSRDSRRLVMTADTCKSYADDDRLQGSPGNFASDHPQADPYVPQQTSFINTSKSSPDYVNINIVSESQEGRTTGIVRSATVSVENKYGEKAVSQRAEPVFIENHEGYDEVQRFDQLPQEADQHLSVPRTCEQSFVYSDQIYAARDPYYVSDVQLPAKADKFEEDKSDISPSTGLRREYNSSYGTQNSVQRKYQMKNDSFEITDYSGDGLSADYKNYHHDISVREESLENAVGFSSYDSHITHKPENVGMHASQKGSSQDDTTSTGKYSDSGYDTLRAEMSLRRDDRRNPRPGALWTPDGLDSSPECSSVVRRRGFDHAGRRPETWSPEKFDRSWGTIDSDLKSKVDESKVVREYSYEYITPEKSSDAALPDSFANSNMNFKKSSPSLTCLESPRMVQETQLAQNHMNLVQDRIKKFTSKALETKENYTNNYVGEPQMNMGKFGESNNNTKMACINPEVQNFREPLKEPLKPLSPQIRSSEAFVSPLKAEFATSESTVVTAQEAQVKNVSDYKRRDEVLGSPLPEECPPSSLRLNSASEPSSIEYRERELRSPQDIMDSRLSRTNIRKFLFDDDGHSEEPKLEQPTTIVKPPLMKKPTQTRSVKALLKNFEEKSLEHMERVNLNQDCSRKKFHSDSEMLSNESSSDECQSEDLFTAAPEKTTLSPTSSVLAELRKSADDKKDDATPLLPPPRPPKKPTLGGEMDTVVTPGYLRLSLTESIQESLKVQEDSESGADEPSWMDTTLNSEQGKQSSLPLSNGESAILDLDKPPEEEAPPPPPLYPPTEIQSPVMRPDPYNEENYLPMSPPKKLSHGSSVLAPASSCSSLSSKHLPTPEPIYPDIFAKTEYEEHTYIEMSGDASSSGASILATGGPSRFDFGRTNSELLFPPESPRYYEIGDKDECQHYEYIYKGQPHYEAIYMEVPNSEKENTGESEKPQIPNKPDELKAQLNADRNYASESALNSSISKLDLKSQSNASSDADDEASKDLESLDPPRNPRFSLSDTFRPASYYLSGAEPSSDPDAQDSSDSDLVPPPPIPMSPPPLDDLDTGGPKAKNFDFDNLETPDPPPHLRNALSSSRSLRVSQSSLRDDLSSSRSSIGKDKRIYEKSESSPSLHTDKLKRRPVFEETLESLHDDDNFILRSEDRYPASAAYPEDCSAPAAEKFQRDRRKPFPQCAEDILLPGDKHEPSARPKSALDHNSSFQGNLDTSYSSNNAENPYVNEAFQQSLMQPANPYQSPGDGREYCNIPSNAKMFMQPERERSNSTGSRPKSPDPYAERNELSTYQNVPAPRTSLSKRNSPQTTSGSVEPTGSPMIDALRGVHSPVVHLQPNHQRTSSEASSRSVVSPTASVLSGSGSLAPIHLRATSNASVGSETSPRSAPYYYSDVIRDDAAVVADGLVGTPRSRSYQLNNQRDLEANKRQDIGRKVNQISSSSDFEQRRERLAHELRTSMEFLEGKTVSSPDERNVYDSDTLRKMKRRAYTPDPELDAKNVFPHGLSIKTDSPPLGPPMGHRRTRSLEGLLDDPPRPFVGESNNVQSPLDVNKMCGGGPSQGFNRANTAAFPSSYSAHFGMRGGAGAPLNSASPSPQAAVTSNRGAVSQMASQRASVSSFHSSGSLPQRTTSPYATSPLPVSPVPPYQVGSRDSLVSRESSTSRISSYDPRVGNEPRSPSNHETLHEEQDWEDDTQWREQLRRASLRHTRSLETLDEGRPRRVGDGASREGRPPAKLSVPSNGCPVPQESSQQRLQQLHWDEYTVDYREGRLGSNQYRNSGPLHSETLERTRRGLTCLEGYEWDEAEEKFKKPGQAGRPQQPLPQSPPNSVTHQPFLVDGLPPSPGTEGEEQRQCQVSPAPPPAHAPPSPPPQLQQHFLAGGGEGSDASSGVGGRPPDEFQGREEPPATSPASPVASPAPQDATSTHPVPDIIPPHDVKLGESLPRRLETNPTSSSGTQGSGHTHTHLHAHHQNYQHHSHTHHQNYQHHPHPHSQNQYHHYKSDDLHKYHHYQGQSYQSNGPSYSNYHGGHGYHQNYQENPSTYANNYKHAQNRAVTSYQEGQQPHQTTVIADYNTLSSQHSSGRGNGTYRAGHYDFQDYHNYKNHQQDYKHHQQEYKHHQDYKHHQQDYKHHQQEYKQHPEYATYDKHLRPHDQRLNGRLHGDLHQQQQFSDSELTVSKQQQQQQQQAALAAAPPGQDSVDVRGLQGLSAGELLGKTHEELVLLLIQLRRHHSALQSARHHSRVERDSQARLAQLDGEHRDDHLRRLASLNHHLHDLDKQYEMGKPLINLVDNMVKLGSLYRGGDSRLPPHQDPRARPYYQVNGFDSLQFSRRIQERRIVAEDLQLQEHELAAADQSDLEEMLERTLVNLQSKSHGANEGPVELERRKKQRRHLEHELSKLRAHLAVSARKLEETAAENSRLEHEMMMLRQKIQITMARNCQKESVGTTETRHIESEMMRVQTLLEDLQRRRIELSHQIQKLTSANPGIEIRPSPTGVVGAAPIPSRRRSHSTWLETDLDAMTTRDRGMDPPETGRRSNAPVYVNASGYGDEISPNEYSESPDFNDSDYPPPPPAPEHMRSYNQLLDYETPILDNYKSDQIYLQSQSSLGEAKQRQMFLNGDNSMRPMMTLDRDAADNKPDGEEQQHPTNHMDINDADDRMKRYYGILPKEKPLEIKTVRIVKRESTERRKDRTTGKRVTIGDSSLTHLLEDDVESDGFSDVENEAPPMPSFASRSASLPRNYGRNGPGEKVSMMAAMMRTSVGNAGTMTRPSNLALRKTNWKSKNENPKDRPLSAHEQLFGFSRESEPTPPASPSKSDPPSPVFKSAAAKEIIKEMASEAEKHRRAVPKEKRRHFTISSSHPLTLETRDTGAQEGARSRDDCDMECALRPRNHPDVVKSTLSTRDLRFNESTIDNILGAPNKIYIPERYMPDADDEKEPTEEERVHREQKAESIRKMLSETQTTVTKGEAEESSSKHEGVASSTALKAKVAAEKKEREHLLALNQILARQVMEKSRVVAVRALTMLTKQPSSSDDDLSPMQPLPLVQQRENYLV